MLLLPALVLVMGAAAPSDADQPAPAQKPPPAGNPAAESAAEAERTIILQFVTHEDMMAVSFQSQDEFLAWGKEIVDGLKQKITATISAPLMFRGVAPPGRRRYHHPHECARA